MPERDIGEWGNGSKIELYVFKAAIIADGYAVLIGMEMYGIVLSAVRLESPITCS